MDSDFRPANRPDKPLRAKIDARQQTPKPEPNFRSPEEVSAADSLASKPDFPEEQVELTPLLPAHTTRKASGGWREKLKLNWPPKKKELIVSVFSVFICGGIVALVLTHIGSKPIATAINNPTKIVKKVPKVTTVPSTLSGLPVDPTINQKPVTGVMIENSLAARPQSWLGQAKVVFEAIAEGGVTRFMALFQDTAPDNVGPIRSARPYYIQWSMGFDAGYAHVGGSPEGLADIKNWGVRDLDQFANGGSYHRISSRDAPHNVYTAIGTLNQLEATKGYSNSNFKGFVRKKASPAKVPTAKTIDVTLSGPSYNAHYDYNPATNSYNRSEGGAAHIDANTNTQISPDVVIALVMPYSLGELDSSGAYYSEYNTIGSGQAFIYQDGTVTTATWTKTDTKSQFTFTDSNNKPVGLNPGQTWITAVTSAGNVASAP